MTLVTALVWLVGVWLLLAPPGQPLTPRAWHHTGLVCRVCARQFGIWGMAAERRYWKAVQA